MLCALGPDYTGLTPHISRPAPLPTRCDGVSASYGGPPGAGDHHSTHLRGLSHTLTKNMQIKPLPGAGTSRVLKNTSCHYYLSGPHSREPAAQGKVLLPQFLR